MKFATRRLRAAALVALTGILSAATASAARADQESDRLRPDDPAILPPAGLLPPAASASAPSTAAPYSPFDPSASTVTVGDRAVRDLTANRGLQPLSLELNDLLLQNKVFKRVANPSTGQAATEHPVYYAADALAQEKESPNIHGFLEIPFKTAYVTPRGLVVENAGVVFQPVGGLVFPIGDIGPVKGFTFVTGVWNSINSAQDDTNVGPWNEMDYFASLSGGVGPFAMTLTYGLWSFPQSTVNKPSTEHNLDLKIAFDDSSIWGKDAGFTLNPYVDIWWAISGSSTVVLGREGDTGYVEIGIVPTIEIKPAANLPIKLTFPTYISVGPEHYWGATNPDGNVGVFSASANATIPLNFIPARYGNWHATVGATYFYLINANLLAAGDLLSGNDNRNVIVGTAGLGVNF
jgi:hypothetical protein